MARIKREEYQILKSLDNKRKLIADEKPYNIAELIQEYEIENGMRYDFGKIKVVDIDTSKLATKNGYIYVKESEELEVKKNIEWANGEIKKVRDLLNNKRYEEEVDDFTTGVLSGLKKALDILDELDEPELPVIPKFVANWIEASRDATYHLLGAVYNGAYSEDMKEWLFKGDKRTRQDNQDKLTRAWIFDYTVEKEKKYHAKIKGYELLSDSVDGCWNVDGKELYIDNDWHDYSGYKTTILTKDEWTNLGINEDNADFVLVEELEE